MSHPRDWATWVTLGVLIGSGSFSYAIVQGPVAVSLPTASDLAIGGILAPSGSTAGVSPLPPAPAVDAGGGHLVVASEVRPSSRTGVGAQHMIYHAKSDRVFLLGGASARNLPDVNDMWTYDPGENRWTELHPSVMPPRAGDANTGGPVAYDSQSDRLILFRTGETWAYDFDNTTWKNMKPAQAPPTAPARPGIGLAYDAESDRVILFGGRPPRVLLPWKDTWSYDYDTNMWTEMNPAVIPPPRHNQPMVYDPIQDRIVMFGGAIGGNRRNDMWAYDYNTDTWTELDPGTGPSPRGSPGMVYDPEARSVIVFGGVSSIPTGEETDDETWSFDIDSNTWSRLRPMMSPSRRAWHWMGYDPTRGRILLFGGSEFRFGAATSDMWTYDSATNVWTLVDDEPADIENEALRQLKRFKDQALARGDGRFLVSLDEVERTVWESLGYQRPLRPSVVTALPVAGVAVTDRGGGRSDLVLGPLWTAQAPGYHALVLEWSDGSRSFAPLPSGWPSTPLQFRSRPWVGAWRQDVSVASFLDTSLGLVTLSVNTRDASLGFAILLDTDLMADLSFGYTVLPWWMDGAHVDTTQGHRVFDQLRGAPRRLLTSDTRCDLTSTLWSATEREELDAVCGAIADLFIRSIGGLARLAIREAMDVLGPNPAKPAELELSRAEAGMQDGFDLWSRGRYDRSIDAFGDAWSHARRAVK